MAKRVFEGRYTTENDRDIVVFLIGMRVNKWRAVRKWMPVFKAMPGMIRELYQNKDLGFISMESYFGMRTTVMIQYWRSMEDLHAYAKGGKHLSAWRHFNKKIGDNDAVGSYEAVYGNMPLYGLAKAAGHTQVNPAVNSAKKRLHALGDITEKA